MDVLIEEYRGFEVYFNTDKETFVCELDNDRFVKKSFSAMKKGIDDYVKSNINFKPIEIYCDSWSIGKVTLVGIRKDKAFVYEKDGIKKQLSSYVEDKCYVYNENYIKIQIKIKELTDKRDELNKEINEINKTLTLVDMKELREKYT